MTTSIRGFFITGTDTDAGKTVAAAAVLCALRSAGLDAVPMKPVQTGCAESAIPPGRRSPDVDLCLHLAGLPEPDTARYAQMVPYRFLLPASPHLAAAKEGAAVQLQPILAAFDALRSAHDAVVVEGAGGVLVPLAEGLGACDLMRALGLPVILTARVGLGTLNHTLLALHELRRAGLHVAGVLFCDGSGKPWGEVEHDNVATVARLGAVPVLGCVPFMPELAAGTLTPATFQARLAAAFAGQGGLAARLGVVAGAAKSVTGGPTLASEAEALTQALWRQDQASLWHPFTKHSAMAGEPFPIMVRGEGIYLFDSLGRRYLDGVSSWWAANLGHSHPRLVAALQRQAAELQHSILGNLSHRPAIELAAALVALFPGGGRRVFFAGDGACAVEASLRIAVQHWHNLGRGGKHRIAAFQDGYHGDTIGAMSVGYVPGFHEPYKPLLFPVVQVPLPDCAACACRTACDLSCFAAAEKVLEAEAGSLAAMIVEPHCQGAAGMRLYPPAYLRRLADCCARLDILLIADEVAMGFGRTGRLFSFEHAGIDPDLVCLGKGLTGGCLAMSACVVKERVHQSFADQPVDHTLYHGHTFAGNPLGAAAALECLRIYADDGIVARAAALGERLAALLQPLAALPSVRNVRSLGLLGAFELAAGADGTTPAARAQRVRQGMLRRGFLVRPLGGTLYLMPPLIIGEAELQALASALVDETANIQ